MAGCTTQVWSITSPHGSWNILTINSILSKYSLTWCFDWWCRAPSSSLSVRTENMSCMIFILIKPFIHSSLCTDVQWPVTLKQGWPINFPKGPHEELRPLSLGLNGRIRTLETDHELKGDLTLETEGTTERTKTEYYKTNKKIQNINRQQTEDIIRNHTLTDSSKHWVRNAETFILSAWSVYRCISLLVLYVKKWQSFTHLLCKILMVVVCVGVGVKSEREKKRRWRMWCGGGPQRVQWPVWPSPLQTRLRPRDLWEM